MKRFIVLAGMVTALLGTVSWAGAITYKGDLEADESVLFPEQVTPPANPPSGHRKLYFRDDGNLYHEDASGNENPVVARGGKNVIVNGDFRLWQRGTAFNDTNGHYGPDRWKQFGGFGNTTVYSRQAFALGQSDVPDEPQYYLSMQKTSGSGAPPELHHYVESVRTFAGQTVTLTYYARAESARNLHVNLRQNFGSGGAPSTQVDTPSITCNLTTGWSLCKATYALGSLSGKTLGTNGDHYLGVRFVWETNANGTVELAHVQLETGSVGTVFEQRPLGLEWHLAARYFRVLGFGMTGGWHAGNEVTLGTGLMPPMRVPCTVTLNDTTPIVNEVSVGDKTGSGSGIVASSITTQGLWVRLNGFTGATAGNPAVAKENDILFCDADL